VASACNEAEKLEAFCLLVRTASPAVDQEAFSEVRCALQGRAAREVGGGSLTSAVAWLAGRVGREALESVLSTVNWLASSSVREVAAAVDLGQNAQEIREKG
jgi:hypothetical protein